MSADHQHLPPLASHILGHVDSTAPGLRFEDEEWTHGEVVAEAATRAAWLASLGIDGRPHIGVLTENRPEAIFWLHAAALAGATIVGINTTRRGDELVRDITHTDCHVVITDTAGAELLDGLNLEIDVWNSDQASWTTALAPHRGAAPPTAPVDPEAPYLLVFTSGTTSAPKAAICSQARITRMAVNIVGMLAMTHFDVAYNAMPWFHSNALYVAYGPWVVGGHTLALRRRFSASGWLPDVRRHRATVFNYVGKPLEYILATPPTEEDRNHRLRMAFGNEANERDIAIFSERFGVEVRDSFGSTEGGVSISRTPDTPPGSLGLGVGEGVVVVHPVTEHECERAVFDEHGRLLNGDAAIGELVNREGVATFEGYWANDEANHDRTRDGWYWSGDLAYRDADGFFYFAGRGDDWMRIDGENLATAPIERVLLRHDDVAMVAVYAVPDARVGDQAMAAVVLRSGAAFDPAGFSAFVAAQPDLGTKDAPRFVRVTPELPITATNKIKKRQLRTERWQTADDVWWRPGRDDAYRRFTLHDADELGRAMVEAGRDRDLETS